MLTLSQIEGPFSCEDGNFSDAEEVARLAIRDASTSSNAGERIVFHSAGKSAQLALPQALAITALRNLLDNALRHTPAAQDIALEMQLAGNTCAFRVLDQGRGLSAEELAMVKERFWRRGSGQGSGLGLSIVAAIAERFGGAIELRQRPGGGLEARL